METVKAAEETAYADEIVKRLNNLYVNSLNLREKTNRLSGDCDVEEGPTGLEGGPNLMSQMCRNIEQIDKIVIQSLDNLTRAVG